MKFSTLERKQNCRQIVKPNKQLFKNGMCNYATNYFDFVHSIFVIKRVQFISLLLNIATNRSFCYHPSVQCALMQLLQGEWTRIFFAYTHTHTIRQSHSFQFNASENFWGETEIAKAKSSILDTNKFCLDPNYFHSPLSVCDILLCVNVHVICRKIPKKPMKCRQL